MSSYHAPREIVRLQFGSTLYGTRTANSDTDIKAVFVPAGRDILLQRAKGVIATQRPKAFKERNNASDTDVERFSLQRFLGLLAEGQSTQIDMIFAPPEMLIGPAHDIWREIIMNRHRLVSKKAEAFVGYAEKQAAKYGIRGSRVAASRAALGLLCSAIMTYGVHGKLRLIADRINSMIAGVEHMALVDIPGANGDERHWEVCDRKLPFSASLGNARDIMQRLVNEYGHRALAAERNEGVDWKACSHAVRVAGQAIELFQTGEVTFPRPDAAHLIEIKTGQLPYKVVSAEIEQLVDDVKAAAAASPLRAEPDKVWIDDFVASVHAQAVRGL
jgi:hypothetical protein